MKKVALALLGLLITSPVFAGEMKTFTNTKPAFTLEYPAEWKMREDKEGGIVQFRPPAEGPKDLFSENITIATEDLAAQPELQNLDAYESQTKKDVEAKLADYKLEDEFTIRRHGIEFQCLEFTGTYQSTPVKIRQYIFVVGKTGYVFSYVAKPETFDAYLAASYHIARSLKINS